MIKKSLPITILIILAVVPWITPALGDIRLPAMFSNHMVIQREMLIPVWGWADPDEKVSVTLCGRTVSTIANSNGKWTLQTGPFTAGGPFELTITGKNTIVIQDVLVGEVWFCSGQSNMQATLGGTKNSQKEIAAADYPKMRTFVVAHNVSPEPLDECRGSWRVCSPKTGRSFTAVGYFFGRELMRELDVPVGLINSSWGSTPAESWTSRKGLVADERLAPILQRFDQAVAELPEKIGEYNKARDEWFDGVFPRDKMSKGFNAGWHKPDFDAEIWKEMKLPSLIENAGLEMNGTLWFRKEVDIPKEWENKDLLMHLGTILDFDVTYLNGIRVGETGYIQGMGFYSPAASRTTLRRYRIPGSLIKQGKSVISVHIMNYISFGGFGRGQGGIMRLVPADDEQAEPVSLEGIWKYAVESNMTPQEIGEIWNKRPRPPVDGY
ncbi:MAG: hypothetical protein JXN60_08540, partial [Lentisphaerae bacterium]|nr:hypothetical protein [Lentisphaerota bacterium]